MVGPMHSAGHVIRRAGRLGKGSVFRISGFGFEIFLGAPLREFHH